jgi:hypothetical protein
VKKLPARDAEVIAKYLEETIVILNDLSATLQKEILEQGS